MITSCVVTADFPSANTKLEADFLMLAMLGNVFGFSKVAVDYESRIIPVDSLIVGPGVTIWFPAEDECSEYAVKDRKLVGDIHYRLPDDGDHSREWVARTNRPLGEYASPEEAKAAVVDELRKAGR